MGFCPERIKNLNPNLNGLEGYKGLVVKIASVEDQMSRGDCV
jgi:hypothetical protein